jgi:hypothetical protein
MSGGNDADAKFRVFEHAAKTGLLVRIQYMQTLRDDPALPEQLRNQGVMTILDAYPVALSTTELTITQAIAAEVAAGKAATLRQELPLRTIPRDRVLNVRLISETTASMPKPEADWQPPDPSPAA